MTWKGRKVLVTGGASFIGSHLVEDGTAVNLGTMERVSVLEAVEEVLRYAGHKATLEFHPEMPTGPYNRAADNHLTKNFWDVSTLRL